MIMIQNIPTEAISWKTRPMQFLCGKPRAKGLFGMSMRHAKLAKLWHLDRSTSTASILIF